MDENSLLYWYPKVKDLIPTPRTEIVRLNDREKEAYYKCIEDFVKLPKLYARTMDLIEDKFKLPVFLRTDEFSNKHFWERSCFLNDLNKLNENLNEIIFASMTVNFIGALPIEAIVVREYIEMDSHFKAFVGNMPVNPERRYFIDNGKIQCHHPYWIEDSIRQGVNPLPGNWKDLLKEANTESSDEINLLSNWAGNIAKVFPGYWSIDFCKARKGNWYMIDMADGEKSWHPYYCEYSNEESPKKEEETDFSFLIEKKDCLP